MKKTMIALAMMLAAGLTVTMSDLHAATNEAGKKIAAPAQELVISGKKPAHFSHATHTALGLDCTTCHHDAKHQPRSETAIAGLPNANSLHCATCHNEKFANAKLRKPMDVFHARCKTCHTAGVNGKKGPTACTGCHTATTVAPDQKAAPAPAAAAPTPAKKKRKAVEGC